MAFDNWRAADLFVDDPKHIEIAARWRHFVIPQLAGGLTGIEQRFAGAIGRANRRAQIVQVIIFIVTVAACFGWSRRIRYRRPRFIALALWPAWLTRGIPLGIAWSARTPTAIASATARVRTA
jgi:hypothetical protein